MPAYADTGAIRLVDSSNLQYFINEDISFNTTSSASGAASEASFTTAITASTMMGGTVDAELSDMFDGAMSLGISLTGDLTRMSTGNAAWTIYNQNGPASPNAACLGAGGTAPTPSTSTGTSFVTSGFAGGEQLSIDIGHKNVMVTFASTDQTPAQVVTAINAAFGTVTVASVVSDAIVFSVPAIASIGLSGNAAASIGLAMPVYVVGTLGDAREIILRTATYGSTLEVERRVFVPEDDTFLRHIERFRNIGASPITFTVQIGNNFGSDSNTTLWGSSNGDAVADLTDTWVGSFQNWSGTTSSDPRIALVFGNPGSPVQMSVLDYVNGDDNPFWIYTITLAPGETKAILNYVVGAGTKAAAQAVVEDLVDPRGRPAALRCIADDRRAEIVNLPASDCALANDTTCDDGNADTTDDHCTAIDTCTGTPVPVPDAGVDDASVGTDGGDTTPDSKDGCGCAVVGATDTTGRASFAVLVSVLVLAARVRRRARRRA